MKICKACNIEKPELDFYYNRKSQRADTSCKSCRYKRIKGVKDGLIEKKKRGIDRFDTLNNWFMTEKEIRSMYVTLKGHMFVKYGKYDDDVIQNTIIQGMAWADKYNPQKASKTVWFQTILKGIFLHQFDPKLNFRIRHHYSLDWSDEDGDENADIVREAVNMTDEGWEDFSEIGELITAELNSDNYPIVNMRVANIKRPQILKTLGLNEVKYKVALEKELNALNDILNRAGWKDHLLWRRKSYIASFIANGGNPIAKCPVCKKSFNKFLHGKHMKSINKVCSEECRLSGLKMSWKKSSERQKLK